MTTNRHGISVSLVCRYCERYVTVDSIDRPDSMSLTDWHAHAECVAVTEPSEKMGGPR